MGLVIETTLGTESQIRLVDEGRGLQSLTATQSRARPAGGPFQLLIQNRHQLGRYPLDFRGLRAALREHGDAGFCVIFGHREEESSADSHAVAVDRGGLSRDFQLCLLRHLHFRDGSRICHRYKKQEGS